ncbi:hypothetical protein JTB14_003215 [Gonioctena quinquepunctata]|nr:hypothetical protein JTB14_003215 [Gonioctena quinquepunctata]
MVRVITQDAETHSQKLAYGIHIYGLKHKCEKSNTPSAPLIIEYCSRCCRNEHDNADCKENLKCPFCGGDKQKCRMHKNQRAEMPQLRGQPSRIFDEMPKA